MKTHVVSLGSLTLALAATPALAAEGPFFSLGNSDFTVLIAFLLFIGILIKFKVPGLLVGMLDKRADGIAKELETARQLRDEAKALLASYERKSREVKDQIERIILTASDDAKVAAEAAKADLARSIERRMQQATDQIAAAEQSAVREVRERAVTVAIAAASDVLAKQITAESAVALIDQSISEIGARLN
jgi:F-type H+-transporting ATPase subunit b